MDHGIETSEERLARGKPEIGRVSLFAEQQGKQLSIIFQDDGRGLNIDRIPNHGNRTWTYSTPRITIHLKRSQS